MAAFQSDFTKAAMHHTKAGTAISAGNAAQAMHHIGHMLSALNGASGPTIERIGGPTAKPDNESAANVAHVHQPDDSEGPTAPHGGRGFGSGKQFTAGTAFGTPKPGPTMQQGSQESALRGKLGKLNRGFGKKGV